MKKSWIRLGIATCLWLGACSSDAPADNDNRPGMDAGDGATPQSDGTSDSLPSNDAPTADNGASEVGVAADVTGSDPATAQGDPRSVDAPSDGSTLHHPDRASHVTPIP